MRVRCARVGFVSEFIDLLELGTGAPPGTASILKAAAELLAPVLRPPNMDAAAIAGAQDTLVFLKRYIDDGLRTTVVDLQRKLEQLHGRLERIGHKPDFADVLELTAQTVANFGRETNEAKRRMMTNVLIHGIEYTDRPSLRRRYFVRTVAELDVEHVRLLGLVADLTGRPHDPAVRLDDVELAMLNDLVPRGFVRATSAHPPPDIAGWVDITDLGRDFLAFVQEPERAQLM